MEQEVLTNFIKVNPDGSTVYPYTIKQLKTDFKVSIPEIGISVSDMETYGVYPVTLIGELAYKSRDEISPLYYKYRKPPYYNETEARWEVEVEKGIYVFQDSDTESADEIRLRMAKEFTRRQLKKQRDELISAPINNVQVATNEDRENIKGTVENWLQLESEGKIVGGVIGWIVADKVLNAGSPVKAMNKIDLESVIATYVSRKAQAFFDYGNKLLQLEQAASVEQVEAL